jgi:hypothetical protein
MQKIASIRQNNDHKSFIKNISYLPKIQIIKSNHDYSYGNYKKDGWT